MNPLEVVATLPGGFGIIGVVGIFRSYHYGTFVDFMAALVLTTLFLVTAFSLVYVGAQIEAKRKQARESNKDA